MNIPPLKVVCFSPTGGTRAICSAIARGFGGDGIPLHDLTAPDVRAQPLQTGPSDLLVVGIPVYAGRMPALLEAWFSSFRAEGTPTVCAVVYGNRDYDDALLELTDRVRASGGLPLAGAAFIGEHSYSTSATPIAVGRPHAQDLAMAEAFGEQIRRCMADAQGLPGRMDLKVPGHFPYRERKPYLVPGQRVADALCIHCGRCAQVCPTEALAPADPHLRDSARCILCCACIKACPRQARTMEEGHTTAIARSRARDCREPKSPVIFMPTSSS